MLSDKPFLVVNTWKSIPSRKVYCLRQTPYELHVFNDGRIIWKNSITDKILGFEQVFENSPKAIKRQLAFHLDFFNS